MVQTRGEKAALILCLFLFWIVLNGKLSVDVVVTGAAVSAALSWFACRVLGISPREERRFLRCLPGVFCYLAYLLGQVLRANLDVIRVILSPGKERPKLVWFPQPVDSPLAQLALANSITLMPGTVTASMGEKTVCVYVLRPRLWEKLKEGGLVKRLRRLEGGKGNG